MPISSDDSKSNVRPNEYSKKGKGSSEKSVIMATTIAGWNGRSESKSIKSGNLAATLSKCAKLMLN
jgi:hypothetical protein